MNAEKRGKIVKGIREFDFEPTSERAYPSMSTRAYVVFNPTTPQREESIRTEPACLHYIKYGNDNTMKEIIETPSYTSHNLRHLFQEQQSIVQK